MESHRHPGVTSHTNGAPSDRFPALDAPYNEDEVGKTFIVVSGILGLVCKGAVKAARAVVRSEMLMAATFLVSVLLFIIFTA